MPNYPTISLQPNQSGNEVKKLQEYLISKGYSIPDGATGYYGNQTKSAVAKLQSDLGVDTAGYPGYWGQRTLSALQSTEKKYSTLAEAPKYSTIAQAPKIAESPIPPHGLTEQQFPIIPPAPIPSPTIQSTQQQISTTQSQITDLQAQQQALQQYGLTDTEQLTKDTSGNYVPKETNVYDTGNKDLNVILKSIQDILKSIVDSGKIVNPNIEIDASLIKQFQEQAEAEFSPYYKGQFSAIKGDLETDLSYLSEQYKQTVETQQAQFKQNLAYQRESEAEKGTIFSGGRMTREQELAGATQRTMTGLGTSLAYGAQKAGTEAERTIGSLNLGGVTYPSYKPYSVSTKGMGGFAPLGTRNLYNLTGGITGSMEREQITAQQLRQAELEEAERRKRVLNFYS